MASGNLLPDTATEWWQCDKDKLAHTLLDVETVKRRADAVQGQILAEIESRGVFTEYGYQSLDAFQRDLLRISRREAKQRANRARVLNPTRTGTAVVAPVAPLAADAAAEGQISGHHVDAIAATMTRIPADTPAEEKRVYEKILVELARDTDPAPLYKAGREIIARLDQDGTPPNDDTPTRPDRELACSWTKDNHLALKGRLDPESGQLLQTLLSPLSKPCPAEDGQPDDRTPEQRTGDGFADLLGLTQRAAQLPTDGGEKPHLIVTISYRDLLGSLTTSQPADTDEEHAEPEPKPEPEPIPTGPPAVPAPLAGPAATRSEVPSAVELFAQQPPLLNWDTPITAEQARRIACDATIIPAVLGTDSQLLDLGRAQRLVSASLRRALNLRDGGCSFPGCTRPPRWCDAHHVIHWINLGPTDLGNLCLLCTEHHRLVHHSDWSVRIANDGLPEFTPPAWLDPHQTPRRNHRLHHARAPA